MQGIGKVDLNNASVEELKAIKGIGQGRAEQIALFRSARGPFASLDDLDQVPHVGNMPPRELEEVKAHLTLRAPGEHKPHVEHEPGKLDVNQASADQLAEVPGIGSARAQELIRYREERGRIRDLSEIDRLPYFREQSEAERQSIKDALMV